MRSIVYRFEDIQRLEELLWQARVDHLLAPPVGEHVAHSEWVLAVFEVGPGRRATAIAARGVRGHEQARLLFEPRDFSRLQAFVRDVQQAGPRRVSAPPPPPPSGDATAVTNIWPPAPRASSAVATPVPGVGARVLLVDDDPDICEVVSTMLEVVGFVVETCTTAEDALSRLATTSYDLLVLDANLPTMNGLELCRTLRHQPGIMGLLPVLFLSANASSRDMVDAFASGADDYVTKPFRAPELGARIFGLLRRARMTATAAASSASS